jgi:hypothetical protein
MDDRMTVGDLMGILGELDEDDVVVITFADGPAAYVASVDNDGAGKVYIEVGEDVV